MIISDIHGSSYYLKLALDIFDHDKFDKLICLGDYLYHGPRNPLPKDYDCQKCLELLNKYQDKLIKIRGNCDSLIDEELLGNNFHDVYLLTTKSKNYFLTHGHLYNEDTDNHNIQTDYLVMGHFHVQKDFTRKKIHYLSPGSISLPKSSSKHGYMIIEDDGYEIRDLISNEIIFKGE